MKTQQFERTLTILHRTVYSIENYK